ncbi:MAG: hypothetical protein HY081_04135 [Gammaproteobacteria bacterium]|nr:hypothetical protein [Gammaproteobacteria bacterium]
MRELAFAIFGFLIGLIPPWFSRKRRLRTHWCALRAEILQCKEKSEALLNDNIQSPLYRLPNIAYQTSYPVLLADGAVDEKEVMVLGKFFGQVQDINRGLDNAAHIYMSDTPMGNKLRSEFDRNRLKAEKLSRGDATNPSLFDQSKDILDRKISLRWWQYKKSA